VEVKAPSWCVAPRVLKTGVCEFYSVSECSRVLNLAIKANEAIFYQSLACAVTTEVEASHFKAMPPANG